MPQMILIGLCAGAASALLFASVASGSILSAILFYLAPLPILIAAIGWSHWAALVAALVAALGLGAVFGLFFVVAFLLAVGLPAWWLGYLTLLARPSPNAPGGVEWYPVGRLVVIAALLGAFVVIATIPTFGLTEESFRASLRDALEKLLRTQTRTAADRPLSLPGMDTERFLDMLVTVTPLGIAVVSTLVNLFNLWLAARIVKVSGRLRRPWPELSAMTFPPFAPAVLAAAVAGSFFPGMTGIVTSIVAAALFTAYAVLGFAVLHAITLGIAMRPLILTLTYLAAAAIYWFALAMAFLGLADTILDIRRRAAGRRGPPTVNSQ